MRKIYTKILFILLLIITFSHGANAIEPQGPDVWDRAAYGQTPGIEYVNIVGYNDGITTSFEPLWQESIAYTVLSTAMSSPYCASTDANDTSAGTGARTVRVKGITSSFAAFTETVTLNGTTSVVLSNSSAQLINSMEVLTAGSGGVNAGNIRCGTGTNTGGAPATIHSVIPIGLNRSQMSWYGVPANKTLICRALNVGSYGVTAAQTIQVALDRYVNSGILKRERILFLNQAGSSALSSSRLYKFEEKTILVFQALSAASTGPVGMSIDCLLIDNSSSNANQIEF